MKITYPLDEVRRRFRARFWVWFGDFLVVRLGDRFGGSFGDSFWDSFWDRFGNRFRDQNEVTK